VRIGTPHQFLYLPGDDEVELRVLKSIRNGKATLQIVDDYSSGSHTVWGIQARNREQNFALNALMDPESISSPCSGLPAPARPCWRLRPGWRRCMDQQRYREIIMTRATVSVGEDIGFLPGTEEEKMTPWMGALTDNLEVLANAAGRRQLGPGRNQRSARFPHQDPRR
jgi:PhoH-like ATPase